MPKVRKRFYCNPVQWPIGTEIGSRYVRGISGTAIWKVNKQCGKDVANGLQCFLSFHPKHRIFWESKK